MWYAGSINKSILTRPWAQNVNCDIKTQRFACSLDTVQVEKQALAQVVELVDTPDLGSGGESCGGSSPFARTNYLGRART